MLSEDPSRLEDELPQPLRAERDFQELDASVRQAELVLDRLREHRICFNIRGRHSGRAVFLDRECRNPVTTGPCCGRTTAQNSFARWLLGPGSARARRGRARLAG